MSIVNATSVITSIEVTLICPKIAKRLVVNFDIGRGSTFMKFRNVVRDSFDLGRKIDDVKFYLHRPFAFVELVESPSETEVSINNLQAGDVVDIRFLLDNIRIRSPLSTLISEFRFNHVKVSKVASLQQAYSHWRSVRGDGNCYYRAIIFGIVENLISRGLGQETHSSDKSSRQTGFRFLHRAFSQITSLKNDENHKLLLEKLMAAGDERCWKTAEEFEEDILSDLNNLDFSLIQACRRTTSQFLLNNTQFEVHGLSVTDAIMASYPVGSIEEYCSLYIDAMGVDAEGLTVDAGLLPSALNCSCYLCFLDRDSSDIFILLTDPTSTLSSSSTTTDIDMNCLESIHILLQPGHFDMLYPKSLKDVHCLMASIDEKRTNQFQDLCVFRLSTPSSNGHLLKTLDLPYRNDQVVEDYAIPNTEPTEKSKSAYCGTSSHFSIGNAGEDCCDDEDQIVYGTPLLGYRDVYDDVSNPIIVGKIEKEDEGADELNIAVDCRGSAKTPATATANNSNPIRFFCCL